MLIEQALDTYFPNLAKFPDLKNELISISSIIEIEEGTTILKQGDYIKVIPLMVSGLAKVFKKEPENGNEVLLYYIKPGESCIMSVMTLLHNETSKVKAVIEEDAEVVIVPSDKAMDIAKNHPQWNEFFYDLFSHKFSELLNVIEILTFSNKDIRLLEYLKKEASLKGSSIIKATHQNIADDLGSSREVISRLLKKLEHDKFIKLNQGSITLLIP